MQQLLKPKKVDEGAVGWKLLLVINSSFRRNLIVRCSTGRDC